MEDEEEEEEKQQQEEEEEKQREGIQGEERQSRKKTKIHTKKLTLADVLDSSDEEEEEEQIKKEEKHEYESDTEVKQRKKKKKKKEKTQEEEEEEIENKALLRSLENEAAMHNYAEMSEQHIMNKEAEATEHVNKKKLQKWNRIVNNQDKLRQFPVQYGKQVHKQIALTKIKKDEMLDEFNKVLVDTRQAIEEKQQKMEHEVLNMQEEEEEGERTREEKIKRAQEAALRRRKLAQQQKNYSRIKKIKSKVYRKRLRRREKAIAEKQGDLHHMDEEELKEEMEKRQRDYLKERISLKHKNASSWMRRQMRYNEHDSTEAAELQRQLAFQRDLVDKQKDDLLKYQNKDRDIVNTLTNGQARDKKEALEALKQTMKDDAIEEETGVMAMNFMREARAKKQQAMEELIDQMMDEQEEQEEEVKEEEEEQQGTRRAFKATSIPMEDDDDDDNEEEEEEKEKTVHIKPTSVLQTIAITKEKDDNERSTPRIPRLKRRTQQRVNPKANNIVKKQANPWLEVVEDERKLDRTTDTTQSNVAIQLPDTIKKEEEEDDEMSDDSSTEDEDDVNAMFQQSIKRSAFSKDNIHLQFDAMKAKAIDEDANLPSLESKALPGWGDWVGAGERYTKAKEEREEKIEKELNSLRDQAATKRMDADLDNVILRASGITVDDKYRKKMNMASRKDGYMTRTHSKMNDANMAMPLGPEWNTYKSFQRSTLANVQLRRGKVVEPLNYERSQQLLRAASTLDDFTTKGDQHQRQGKRKLKST